MTQKHNKIKHKTNKTKNNIKEQQKQNNTIKSQDNQIN